MSSRIRILLVQLPIPPLGPQPIRGNVPLAAGYLKLFAERHGLAEYYDIEILPAQKANQLGDQAMVAAICEHNPQIVGFTCYLWNIDRTLWVANQVKQRRAQTQVLLGGPEITRDNEWVLDSPCVDYAVIGEGEQTFAQFLAMYADRTPAAIRPTSSKGIQLPIVDGIATPGRIAGLAQRVNGRMVFGNHRTPMRNLDDISSPYLTGILNAGDQEQLLLETIRGCIFKCKFCYYPKAYDGLYYVSREKILANLAHARCNGAKEVYMLDPTLNQRRDFSDFLELLKQGNPERQLEYYAELRGEGVTPAQARLMREANFKEVEIGLQSIDPITQDLMERRNNLKAFEKGVRALQAEGIKVKVDLIVGLPGDTVDSVRRGMHYLRANRLYGEIQVFQLSILPGTSFRAEADRLGVEFQARPPYYVLRTPTLTLDDMLALLEEAEELFEYEFDPLPEPTIDGFDKSDAPSVMRVDLDRLNEGSCDIPGQVAQAFTLWFRTTDPYGHIEPGCQIVRRFLALNPFSTLQIVIETDQEFPFDVFHALRSACVTGENVYLDRFYEFTPGSRAGARRIVVVASTVDRACFEARFSADWRADADEYCDVVWRQTQNSYIQDASDGRSSTDARAFHRIATTAAAQNAVPAQK
jgi:radical SAM superfamily enzyme YgiQ (UPF0313 family)